MSVTTTLDPQVRRDVLAALAQLPVIAEADGRMSLLGGLDATFKLSVARSPVPLTDLQNIVDAATAYIDPAQKRWGLAELLNNALDLAAGSQVEPVLTTLRDRIIPTPGQLDFTRAVAAPPLPEAEYVASQCQVAPAKSAVTPTSDDRDYLDSVRDRYRAWRDAADYKFISSAIIPPAEYVLGDVTHRRVFDSGAGTARLWSLCRTSDELFDHRRLMVLGRPGVGKTSLIQYLARQFTEADGTLLPVVVSLRAWQDPPDKPRDLLGYIKDFLVTPVDRKAYPRGGSLAANLDTYLGNADQQRRLVFLLDDYNRLPNTDAADYKRRLDAIRDFADEYYRAAMVVVSRSLDYDGGLADCDPEFEIVEVNPWGRAQITEYFRRNAPELLPYANDPQLLQLVDIPQQLAQIVDVLRTAGPPPQDLFKSARNLLQAFVERLFTFGEQAGSGDPALRPEAQTVLTQVATGLAHDNQRGSYVAYPQAVGYLGTAPPNADRILKYAADSTILDIVPGLQKQVGFDGQLMEDYFATLGGAGPPVEIAATNPVALNAALDSGSPLAALDVARALDNAGMLMPDATPPTPVPTVPAAPVTGLPVPDSSAASTPPGTLLAPPTNANSTPAAGA